MDEIPKWLESTIALLKRAYPDGVSQDDWDGIMFLLYEHMSDRALAKTVSYFTGIDYPIHYNDVLRIGAYGCEPAIVERVRMRLNAAGYDEWVAEEG